MKETVLEIFKRKTGADIGRFLSDFVEFSNTYYPVIVEYYQGKDVNVDEAFSKLDDLMVRAINIEPLFDLKYSEMNQIEFWELLDQFSDCQTKLWTINNLSKWLRSSIVGRYRDVAVVDRVLRTKETFEDVAASMGSANRDDDWLAIARNNFIEEEDYDPNSGGGMFKVSITGSSGNSTISNIIDHLDSKKILGKDINKSFYIKNGDLAVVEFDDAVLQALDTVMNSLKGSIPEHPTYGFTNEAVGVSARAFQYPLIFRNLLDMLQRDGRFTEASILDIYREQDCIFMKIQVRTVTNNYLVTNIEI